MIHFLYNLGIFFYTVGIKIAALWNPKARAWVRGRRDWDVRLRKSLAVETPRIWMHVSSLGEFEQGRPVLEKLRERYPRHQVVLSFFSPSGYEIRKDDEIADVVCYLPADSPGNAWRWINIVRPEFGIFVKYDIWVNHIFQARKRHTKLILISALMEENSRFLKGMLSGLFTRALNTFQQIFTQDEATARILAEKLDNPVVKVAGDTRIDRVSELPAKAQALPEIEEWISGRFCVVCGSTYEADEAIIESARRELTGEAVCWIIAPHEINDRAITNKCQNDTKMIQYSSGDFSTGGSDCLWIDNVGMLSRIYRYADLVHVGGGFGETVHNTQEPAAFGNAITFGPNHKRYIEAVDLVRIGAAFEVNTDKDFIAVLKRLRKNDDERSRAIQLSAEYIQTKAGATQLIVENLPV